MRIAVVGATGRIGAKLTENLLAKGHSVKAAFERRARPRCTCRERSRTVPWQLRHR